MARPRRSRGATAGYGKWQTVLSTGQDFFREFETPPTDTDIEAAWCSHGERLTRDYAAYRPGHRPWAWWRFEAPHYHLTRPAVMADEPVVLGAAGLLSNDEQRQVAAAAKKNQMWKKTAGSELAASFSDND